MLWYFHGDSIKILQGSNIAKIPKESLCSERLLIAKLLR